MPPGEEIPLKCNAKKGYP